MNTRTIDQENRSWKSLLANIVVLTGILLPAGQAWGISGTFTVTETWRVTAKYENWGAGDYNGTQVHQGTQVGTITVTNDDYTMLNQSGGPLSTETRTIRWNGSNVSIDGDTVMPYLGYAPGLIGYVYLSHFMIAVPLIDGQVPIFHRDDSFDTSGSNLSSLSGYGKLTGPSLTVTATSTSSLTPVAGRPTITQQPTNQQADAGGSVTFCISAMGSPTPTYQWQKYGGSVWQNISGATSSCYTISSTSAADAGSYRAVASNAYGTTPSDSVVLTVRVPDLVADPSSSVTPSSVAAGTPLVLTGRTRNVGSGWASSFLIKFYLSTDQAIDASDTVLGTKSVGSIAAAGSRSLMETLTVPASQAPGSYYVCWEIDSGGTVEESNEANNEAATTTTVTVIPPSSITVTDPNGGQSLAVGSTLAIQWSKVGDPGAEVEIALLRGGFPMWMSFSTPNDGSYHWTIPAWIPVGTDYTIGICSATNSAICDESDAPFSISLTGQAADALDTDGDGIPDTYEDAHGMDKNDPADANLDPDGDGLLGRDEFQCGSAENNAQSTYRLEVTSMSRAADGLITLQWRSAPGIEFHVERATAPNGPWTEVGGTRSIASAFETSASFADGTGSGFYRVCTPGIAIWEPEILEHPADQHVMAGGSPSFEILVDQAQFTSFRWQLKPAGGSTWIDLEEGPGFRGVHSRQLTALEVTTTQSGDQFRCIATNSLASTESTPATLTVSDPPVPRPDQVSDAFGMKRDSRHGFTCRVYFPPDGPSWSDTYAGPFDGNGGVLAHERT